MVDAVRSTALLASLSAGEPAAKPQSVEFTFDGPNIDEIGSLTNPAIDTWLTGIMTLSQSQIIHPVGVFGQDVSLNM